MVLRHPTNKFAPEAYVFPGGALDPGDCNGLYEPFCHGLDRRRAARSIPDMPGPEHSLGAWIAVVRECFEEVGILPAYTSDGALLSFSSAATAARFRQHRRDLNARKITLDQILQIENLRLATDRIFYYSHWITPELSPIRYDVRFFVTIAPEYQHPQHDEHELTDHIWITPQEALAANGCNNFFMVLPTLMTMRELSFFKTTRDVMVSTQYKSISPILTRLIPRNKDYVEIMPDGAHFAPSPVCLGPSES